GELAEGKHTIHAVMEYEFTQNGQKRNGEIRSKDSDFEVVAADAPDDLVASRSDFRTRAARTALSFEGVRAEAQSPDTLGLDRLMPAIGLPPQVTWEASRGVTAGLRCINWYVQSPPAMDLCFEAEIQDVKTGKSWPADSICVLGDATGSGHIVPRDFRAFAKDH